MKKKISLMEVKQALHDGRFRDTMPLDMRDEIAKWLQNPGCPCNLPLYRKIIKNCKKQLQDYYPNSEIEEDDVKKLADNHWIVINCKRSELEIKLKTLGPGRKQLAVAIDGDEATVVINELDVIY